MNYLKSMYQRLTPKQKEIVISGLFAFGLMVVVAIVVFLAVPHFCDTCNLMKNIGG